MTLHRIDTKVGAMLADARAKAVARRDRREADVQNRIRSEFAKEERRRAFVAAHGALLWRAMAWYGQNRFTTSVLNCFQGWGDLTPSQLDGLRKTVSVLEHGTRSRTL